MRDTTALSTITGQRVTAGTCMNCGFVNADPDSKRAIVCAGPRCGQRVRLSTVNGYVNGAIPCDDRCQYATGPNCSCSCGGGNHRAGYIRVEQVPVWVRERDARRHADKVERKTAQAATRRGAARERAQAGRTQLLAEHPDLAVIETDRYADTGRDFVDNIRAGLSAGYLSEGRITAALRMIAQDKARDEQRDADDARKAVARVAGVTVPTGRHTVTVTIARTHQDIDYRHSYHGKLVQRMCVRHPGGWQAWGTIPRALQPSRQPGEGNTAAERDAIAAEWQGWVKRLEGSTITLTAMFGAGRDGDTLTGRFTSPKLVDVGAATAPAPRASTTTTAGPASSAPARPLLAMLTRLAVGSQLAQAAADLGLDFATVYDAEHGGRLMYAIEGRRYTPGEAADYLLADGRDAAQGRTETVIHPDRLAEAEAAARTIVRTTRDPWAALLDAAPTTTTCEADRWSALLDTAA